MTEPPCSIEYDEIWQRMSDGFQLSDLLHGPPHWKQVEQNGLEILESSGADLLVVQLFAVLHDSQRQNDGYDPEHGYRAAEVAAQVRNDLFVVSDVQMELLCLALQLHNDGKVTDDPTVGTCWDADRMDLPRVGIQPDSALMSTPYGKQWALNYRTN